MKNKYIELPIEGATFIESETQREITERWNTTINADFIVSITEQKYGDSTNTKIEMVNGTSVFTVMPYEQLMHILQGDDEQ